MKDLELQARVISELQLGTPGPEIAAKFEITLAKVTRIKNKYEDAVRSNTVDQLLQMDELLIDAATDQLKRELAPLSDNIEEARKTVSKAAQMLDALDCNLIKTAEIANNKLRVFISSSDSAAELVMLIDGLTTLRNSFFNKNVTQVNIQNNMNDTPPYDFSSDLPGEVVNAN